MTFALENSQETLTKSQKFVICNNASLEMKGAFIAFIILGLVTLSFAQGLTNSQIVGSETNSLFLFFFLQYPLFFSLEHSNLTH